MWPTKLSLGRRFIAIAQITNVSHSHAWQIAAMALIIPVMVFGAFGRHLGAQKQAWFLLAIVLVLSLSVTGINASFSYISNYFTNALVKKNQDMAYVFVAVYFSGFLAGIPIVAFYSYVQNYLGMRWREWMTSEFLRNYFKNRNYYEIEMNSQITTRISASWRTFVRLPALP